MQSANCEEGTHLNDRRDRLKVAQLAPPGLPSDLSRQPVEVLLQRRTGVLWPVVIAAVLAVLTVLTVVTAVTFVAVVTVFIVIEVRIAVVAVVKNIKQRDASLRF